MKTNVVAVGRGSQPPSIISDLSVRQKREGADKEGIDEGSLHCCCENGDWCSCSVDNSLAIHQKVDHEVDWEDGSGHKNLP